MKQAKRKKSAAEPGKSLDADMTAAVQHELPDAAYVEQLLAATAPLPAASNVAAPVAMSTEMTADGLVCLPAQCLMRDAVDYRQRLLNCLPVQSVAVDVAAVERIDAAFMQVLLAFVRSRSRDVTPVAWLNVNSVFVEAARLLGLQAALAIPEASAAA